MSVIRGMLNQWATRYDLDTSTLTPSRQPIEQLANPYPLRALFRPKKQFFYYLTGHVEETDDIVLTELEVQVNQVLLLDGVYYRLMRVNVLRSIGARGRSVVGYSAKTEIWGH